MKKITRIALMAAGFVAPAMLSGCGSTASAPAHLPISVSVNPPSGSVQVSQTASFMATVQNDSANKGLTWSLSGAGCSAAACGALSANSSGSGVSITYMAPASVPAPATVTLTATSVADGTKSAMATITVTAAPAISVSVNPPNCSVQVSQTASFMATVQNDSANKGVTWSLSGAGCSAAACGALSASSSASGAPITYTAPASVPNPATVTLTASSVTDRNMSAAATITITPPPPPISISFNGGNSQTISQGQSIPLMVTVSNDSSGKGVTWSLSGQGALSKQSGFSVQYDGPAGLASTITAMVTATSVADTTKSAVATITVTPPPLAISTTALLDGVVGTPYSQTIQASGGVAPFTWVVSAGTLPSSLNLDNSTTSTLTISGTPDTQQTGVQFTIQVTDSANQSASQSYTVNIHNPPALTITTSSVPPGTINVA